MGGEDEKVAGEVMCDTDRGSSIRLILHGTVEKTTCSIRVEMTEVY